MYYNNYINYYIILVNKSHRQYITYFAFHSIHLGLAVSIPYIGCVDLCSSPEGENTSLTKKDLNLFFALFSIIHFIHLYALFCRLMLS